MTMRVFVALALCVSLALVSASADAAGMRLGISGGFGSFNGDDFELAEAGPTFGGEFLFGLSPNLYLGAGIDYSSYGIENTSESVGQFDIDAAIRYFFPSESARFFLGGVLGYSNQSLDVGNSSASAKGFALGPVVGVAIPVGQVAIDISVSGYYHSYGDISADGDSISGTDSSGFRFLGRIGLGIPLGGTGE